jgi:Asp-tRNA(Asn)/Glu-tRNA(Gln) amidotransferase B subunit
VNPIANTALSSPSSVTTAITDEIEKMINQKKTQSGGGDLQSGGDIQSTKCDQCEQSGGTRMPDIEPQINEYIENHEKLPRIPKRNYTEYDGNLSQLLNQIIREKMTDFENKQGLTDKILNSKSYKDVLASVNELFISKPDIQAAVINQLVQTIKESKISDKALQKVIESAAKQIKSAKGGTRKKR